MSRTLETRLAKVEMAVAPKRLSHDDWLAMIGPGPGPAMTAAEAAGMDAQITAEAIAEHGSLAAAAVAARAKARRTQDPMDDFLAADLECRAGMGRGAVQP